MEKVLHVTPYPAAVYVRDKWLQKADEVVWALERYFERRHSSVHDSKWKKKTEK